MAHLSPDVLRKRLQQARERVVAQGRYRHYKHPEHIYTVVDTVVLEETDGIGVVYRSEYGASKGLVFVRPIDAFCETIVVGDTEIPRFGLIR